MGVDETDIRILEHLQKDGRSSLRKMAEELDLSPSTVSNRFHDLKESEVIKGFRPVIDHDKVGFGLTTLIEVSVDTGNIEKVVEQFLDRERVTDLYEVTGSTDIVITCKFIDRKDMNRYVKEFQKIEGVASTETKVVLTTPKEGGSIDLGSALQE